MELKYGGERREKKYEGIQEIFMKWTMGVDKRTPGYMSRKEIET